MPLVWSETLRKVSSMVKKILICLYIIFSFYDYLSFLIIIVTRADGP